MNGIQLFRFLVIITGVLLVLALPAAAQGERGAITGTITDQSEAVIPDVEITVTNVSTGVKYDALSTGTGTYRVSALPPAVYNVSATKSGFKRGLAENIRVGVAATVNIDLRMELGEAVETINITGEAPLLQTTAQVGTDVNPTEFNTWPIFVDDNQRQPQSFIFNSLPGTTGSPFEGSINGGQYYSHEILIDGVTIGRNDLAGGSTEFTPSTEQVSEFQLQTNAGAQYGGAGSAVANFSIKSGTNQFHGTAYLFNGNSALSSKGLRTTSSTPKRFLRTRTISALQCPVPSKGTYVLFRNLRRRSSEAGRQQRPALHYDQRDAGRRFQRDFDHAADRN